MDEVTQQNAALAEQTSAASAAMSDKAREMAETGRVFQGAGQGRRRPLPKRCLRQRPRCRPGSSPAACEKWQPQRKAKPAYTKPAWTAAAVDRRGRVEEF